MTDPSMPRYDAQELSDRLGLELRRGPQEHRDWPVTRIDVTCFKEGDTDHSMRTRDGALIPKGVPVEALRKELAASGGMQKGPDGKPHRIEIPPDVADGEGWLIGIAFTMMRPQRPEPA